jgi:RimJ/RimL family protein N-acetyltransferase
MLGGTVRGKRVTLRTTIESDLADHNRWHADPESTKWLPRRPVPQSIDQRKDWLKETAKDHGLIHWELEADGTHAGYCAARLLWPPTADAWWVDSFFITPDLRRRGLGIDAARALHRYLVDYLGLAFGDAWLHRDDSAGRRIAESLGYVEYAHGRDVFYHDGRYWDDWRGILKAEDFRKRFPDELEYPTVPGRLPQGAS